MADRKYEPSSRVSAAKKLYRVATRIEILSAVYILVLCAAFVLETRAHRNLFYLLALPVFLVNLYALDARRLWESPLVRLAALYLGYFLAAGFFGEGFDWDEMADLLRVAALLSVFGAVTVLLAARDPRLEQRLFFWLAVTATAWLAVLFAAVLTGLDDQGWRLAAFGLASQPVIGATLYGFVILIAAFALLPRATTWPARLLWLAVIALSAVFMILASSRGPLLALAAAVVIGLLIIDRRLTAAVIVLTAGTFLVAVFYEFAPVEMLYERDQSGHFALWQQALAAIAERPWFGYGSLTDITFTAKYGPQRSPHNLFLANHIYTGLPGSLLLLVLLGRAIWQAARLQRQDRPLYLALLAFGIAASLFDTRSLVQNLGREWITIWLPLALLAARGLHSRGAPAQPEASQVLRQ